MAGPTAQQDPGRATAHHTALPGTEGLGQLRETFLPKRISTVRIAAVLFMGVIP
ncbi:hypothetical protein ACF09J_28800 [Streptomyces sp. NPDC014889]|uniref:hypothetical protein n=1 Tax=Streptomyces sp. NPDC014889 TaxID=3364928 RepID=UPI0036FFA247